MLLSLSLFLAIELTQIHTPGLFLSLWIFMFLTTNQQEPNSGTTPVEGYFINLSNWPVTKWEQWTYHFWSFLFYPILSPSIDMSHTPRTLPPPPHLFGSVQCQKERLKNTFQVQNLYHRIVGGGRYGIRLLFLLLLQHSLCQRNGLKLSWISHSSSFCLWYGRGRGFEYLDHGRSNERVWRIKMCEQQWKRRQE